MVNTRGTHKRRRLPAAIYLCYLLVAVLAFTGASVAGYRTESTGGDSARVARFDVTAGKTNGQADKIELDYNNVTSTSYSFWVSNADTAGSASEVLIRYDVTVKLPQALQDGIVLKLDGKNASNVSDNTYTFENAGSFSAGEPASNSHVLSFEVQGDIFVADAELTGISVTVNAEQVD